jgi:hypothetical protein
LPVTPVAAGLAGSVDVFGEADDAGSEGVGGVDTDERDGLTDGANGAGEAAGAEATGIGSRDGDPDRMTSSATTTRMATSAVARTRIQPLA